MTAQDTSLLAWKYMNESGKVSENRKRVYNIFYEHGNMTGAECAMYYKNIYKHASQSEVVRNRITELVQMQAVDEIGQRIDINTMMLVKIYGIVKDKMPIPYVKKTSKHTLKLRRALEIEIQACAEIAERYSAMAAQEIRLRGIYD